MALVLGVCGLLCVPATAGAAVFTGLGQVTQLNTGVGACSAQCDAWQYTSEAGGPQYTFPYDGVITRWQVKAGENTAVPTASQFATARVYHSIDSNHATVVREGTRTNVTATDGSTITVWDRVPAAAGDLLGVRMEGTGAATDSMHAIYQPNATSTAQANWKTSATAVGATATAESGFPVADRLANIYARFEQDTDHDGYGDGSQDLCTNDGAHGGVACSGSLWGSNLQVPYENVGSCGYACMQIQTKTADGASTATSARGVVVRLRLQAPRAGSWQFRTIGPDGSGAYSITASADPIAVTWNNSNDDALYVVATRLPIAAGGYVGLVPPASGTIWTSAPAANVGAGTYTRINAPSVGTSFSLSAGASLSDVLLYDADIEPDADGDGYGDVTQDACPTDASTQGACPAPPDTSGGGTTTGTGSGSGIGGIDTTPTAPLIPTAATVTATTAAKPSISSLKWRYASFEVAATGKALTAATKKHKGSAVLATLSAGAKVRFTVRRCTSRTGCSKTSRVHVFTRTLKKGKDTIAYSGRYKSGKRTRSLAVGRYRIDAAIVSASGKLGKARTARFAIVR